MRVVLDASAAVEVALDVIPPRIAGEEVARFAALGAFLDEVDFARLFHSNSRHKPLAGVAVSLVPRIRRLLANRRLLSHSFSRSLLRARDVHSDREAVRPIRSNILVFLAHFRAL